MMKIDRISASQLEDILTTESAKILIVDCRPLMSFNRQRIAGAIHFFCPSIMKRRFATKGNLNLDTLLPIEVRRKLRNGEYKRLVIYDETDKETRVEKHENTDINIIVQSLKFHSYELSSASLLKGGYKRFKSEVPNLCTVLRPSAPLSGTRSPTCNDPPKHRDHSKWTEPTQLLPHLFIGDEQHSLNKELLHRLDITAILNVSSTCCGHVSDEFAHKVIPVRDSNTENISLWFTEALQFIDKVHCDGGKILVHCKAGISRSATICIAYLMYRNALSLEQAYEYVRSRRTIISPNMNFMQQLYEFERAAGRHARVDHVTHLADRKMRDVIYPSMVTCSPLHTETSSTLPSGYFNFSVCALSQT